MSVFKQAKRVWCGTPDPDTPNVYARFRATFGGARPRAAVLRISAEDRYFALFNGKPLAAQQYSDYPGHPVFDEIPLDGADFAEKNVLDVTVFCQNEDCATSRRVRAALIFEITSDGEVLAASGADTEATDRTGFTCGEVERLSHQLSFSFRYDATAAAPEWQSATVLPEEYDYEPRPIPQLTVGAPVAARVIAAGAMTPAEGEKSGERMLRAALSPRDPAAPGEVTLPAAFAPAEPNGAFVRVDLGGEQVGYFLLCIDTPAPTDLTIGFSEHLSGGRVPSFIGGRNFACTVRTKAGENRVYFPFKRFGARYFELHASRGDFTLRYLGVCPVDYPVSHTVTPDLPDERTAAIYAAAVKTLRCCMHEHYEDCPWREQGLYTMDSRNQMLFGYEAFGETRLPRASLRLLAAGLREDGFLELNAPARVSVTIPSFSLVFLLQLSEYYDRTGDDALVRELYPVCRAILAGFAARPYGALTAMPAGYWNFYEWQPDLDGGYRHDPARRAAREAGADAPLNAFYAMALAAGARLAVLAGEAADAKVYGARREALATAYGKTFYDPVRRAYRLSDAAGYDGIFAELTQILTLVSGLCRETDEETLTERLLAGEFSPAVSLSHRVYLYEWLLRDPARYRDALLADAERRFGAMLDAGSDTLWETEKGAADFSDAGSLCHGWSALPVLLYAKIFGKT